MNPEFREELLTEYKFESMRPNEIAWEVNVGKENKDKPWDPPTCRDITEEKEHT